MKFNEIPSRNTLADFLSIKRKTLTYVLFEKRTENCYDEFLIPKKDGTARHICASKNQLKVIQKKLSNSIWDYQTEIWNQKGIKPNISHAFEKNKSIITNAKIHRNKRFVICYDLKDFFESIHFGRIVGFFETNNDYKLPHEVAVTIAQLACYQGYLPQGSPLSPILTNLICQILDINLLKVSKKYKLDYTRYADDLTFSTNRKDFLLVKDNFEKEVKAVIKHSGFTINDKKTRLIYKDSRQVVTGLVVNKKINVKKDYYKEMDCSKLCRQYKKGPMVVKI